MNTVFSEAYKKLNDAQRQAVDTIEGPVMVVAGPGTGKTQVLTLRIANILTQTDTAADGILCLTFTNSGVTAMERRLVSLIGQDGSKVKIKTFHSFGAELLEEFYAVLGYERPPKLLDDIDTVLLIDDILESHPWQHIRTRGSSAEYAGDLKSLVSMLKRDDVSHASFLASIDKDISRLESDPDSISSRGPTKGQLKKEIQTTIDGLLRTKEVVEFYRLYEEKKHEEGFVDYDDLLALSVRLVEESDDVRDTIRERFLYVLVDEHQDSSRVQNAFLEAVWGGVDQPNLFVVGDDRQLIYGFSGAALSHFDNFKNVFGRVTVITLTNNYRSTQTILDASDTLLQSALADGKLIGSTDRAHPLELHEADFPRDEIIRAGLWFKEKLAKDDVQPEHCALLVPKNSQVRNAVTILRDLGLPVESKLGSRLFDTREYRFLLLLISFIEQPNNPQILSSLLLHPFSGVSPFAAHTFLAGINTHKLSLADILTYTDKASLFSDIDPLAQFGQILKQLLDDSSTLSIYGLVQIVGNRFLLDRAPDHDALTRGAEIVRTILQLVMSRLEREPNLTLSQLLVFFSRLETYRHHFSIASIGTIPGIQVMTLHGSKGLEFDAVWIAHMDEKSLMSGKRASFTLPEDIKERIQKKDEDAARRELYVAITRAKYFCALSYASETYTGGTTTLANIVAAIPETFFTKHACEETENFILAAGGPKLFVGTPAPQITGDKDSMIASVAEIYPKAKVSVTLLNNFYECPWKWYFRSLLQLPEPGTASLVFGSVVHEAIEQLLKGVLDTKGIKTFVTDSFADDVLLDDATKKRLLPDAIKTIELWAKTDLPNVEPRHVSEQSLSIKDLRFPEITITGKIDLQETIGERELRVTDFKTGKSKTKSVIEKETDESRLSSYLRQLAMYSYLINKTTKGDIRVIESVLSFIEEPGKDRRYSTTIGQEHLDFLERDIADYVTLAKNGAWVDRPCDFKPWGGSTECDYCKRAKEMGWK